MGNIQFNYHGEKYRIFFYPCGFMVRITKVSNGGIREIKYDSNTTVKDFLNGLEKIRFGE